MPIAPLPAPFGSSVRIAFDLKTLLNQDHETPEGKRGHGEHERPDDHQYAHC